MAQLNQKTATISKYIDFPGLTQARTGFGPDPARGVAEIAGKDPADELASLGKQGKPEKLQPLEFVARELIAGFAAQLCTLNHQSKMSVFY